MSTQLDGWSGRQGEPVELAVRQRYCSSLTVEFQESNPIHNHVPAFAILWLKEIPDDKEKTVTLPVWKGDLKRAEANCELENGKNLGHIEVCLRFRPGASDHHKKLSSKDKNLADVMEVLKIANDSKIQASMEEAAFESHNSIPYHDSHKRSWPQLANKEHGDKLHETTHKLKNWKVSLFSNPQDSARSNLNQNSHTAQWAKHKVEDAGGHISGHFQRHEQDPNI